MRTGIMGGTFDPIHIGHLYLAHEAKEVLGLDRIIFMPSGLGPHKEPSSTPKHLRLEMVRLAIADCSYFQISELEINRNGYSYSIDTYNALREIYPSDQFFFITGADAFMTIESWKRYEALLQGMHFVAAYRPLDAMGQEATMDALRQLIDRLEAKGARSIRALPIIGLDVSSSDLRKRIAGGRHIRCLIPEPVRALIEEHKLYGWKESTAE